MCGIAGIYRLRSSEPVRKEMLRRMCDAMVHRGPDDEGYYIDGPIGFGHRRLSIIDLAGGHQPMSNEDGSVWITYNGEIYNYQDLQRRLRTAHRLATNSDTETIVHLYEEKGEETPLELNGIFAFALWDRKQKKLILVRDRFGIKPLYYTVCPDGTLIFASEIKAILATDKIDTTIDYTALAEHFTFHNTFADRTIFNNIKILEPGTMLTCQNGRVEKRTYWDIQYQTGEVKSEKYYTDNLRDLFEAAVRRQLVSEVPVGGYLSGGMDSGSIAAVAAREIRPFHTFTCGFDTAGVSEFEQQFDERVEAELLSKMLDTQHHERHIYPGDMEGILPGLIWHLEDFRVGISYQIYAISELISQYATVVLSGVGGDELFAGYPWRYEPILDMPVGSDFDKSYYQLWIRLMDDNEKQSFFSDDVNAHLRGFSSYDRFREVISKDTSDHPLHRALYFDAKTFLHGLFVVEDKLSMAHSIETRVPFLDHELVDFVLGMPPELKLKNGQIKYILKEAMKGLLPEETLWRRKQGFTPPDQTWYKGDTFRYIRNLLLGDRAVNRGYFKTPYIQKILDDHVNGRENHRFLIWSLMCFEWWNRLFIDNDPLPETRLTLEPANTSAESVLV